MSHGAAGFAYALAALAAATGRNDFAQAGAECMAYENETYDAARHNWPDLRVGGQPQWPCQWCHGAPGIGLARLATMKRGGGDAAMLSRDIANAVAGVERGWPAAVDTLCCGTLGSIEFFCEAGAVLERDDLRELAARRLMAVLQRAAAAGDLPLEYRQAAIQFGFVSRPRRRRLHLLRRIDASLPNVLIWE